MKNRIIFTLLLAFLTGNFLSAQSWRSTLYPANWVPQGNFYTDKIIQDFSYAGYRRGEAQIPTITTNIKNVTASPYLADKTGKTDVTAKIQKAIDDVSAAGGGVVYLPAGTYKVSPGNNSHCLLIKSSNVILRGDGTGKTFLLNSSFSMREKTILKVAGGSNWYGTETNKTLLAKDLTGPTKEIPVQSAAGYSVGDIVILRNYIGDAWINEHKISQWLGYGSNLKGIAFCREVLKVNLTTNTITVDAPIRYSLLTRDKSAVYKINGMISEVGIEGLSIGNVQNPATTGWGEEDYNNSANASYYSHASYAISLSQVRNGWVDNVASYRPAGNSSTAHLLSNGLLLNYCKNTTVQNCYFQRPQFGGGGGNGYMYRVTGSENLVQHCTAEFSRHGLVYSSMCTSGNVYHKCTDIKTGVATGASGQYSTSGSGSDHHMHFSTSNLIDQCTSIDSYFAAGYRNYGGDPKHGVTAAHTVYWNTNGSGTKFKQLIHTQQGRYGYAIGTSGTSTTVKTGEYSLTGSAAITAPVDHVEGVGIGSTLIPQSLFLDQVSKRINAPSPCANNTLPSINLTATSTTLTVPSTITLNADAADANGSITKVAFYQGSNLLFTDFSSPFSHSVSINTTGSYSYTAIAYDNCDASKTSSPVSVTLTSANLLPTIKMTAPVSNSSYTAPATINLLASAMDPDGTIQQVQFYHGTTLIGVDATSPYSISWPSVAAGSYSVTAKATDNKGGISTSVPITVNVVSAPTGDILGSDCVLKNSTNTYQLAAILKNNATAYSWWYTGSAQSITPVSTDNSKATLVSGSGITPGNICIGVNYNVSPWYKQYCKSITLCGAKMDASILDEENTFVEELTISPNPSTHIFQISSNKFLSSIEVVNSNGEIVFATTPNESDEIVYFGEKFPSGLYVVKLLYKNGRTEVKKIQKTL